MELKEGDLNSASHIPFGLVSTKVVSGVVEAGSGNGKGSNDDSEKEVLQVVGVRGSGRDKNKCRGRQGEVRN